jgi:hypothetical protein
MKIDRMPEFKVFHMIEHIKYEIDRIDNRVFIIYDDDDSTYYYYGTRNIKESDKYVNYKGNYHVSQSSEFVNFLTYIFGTFSEVLTTELYSVNIEEHEYAGLTYKKLKSKLSKENLISAYDTKNESISSVNLYIKMLNNCS